MLNKENINMLYTKLAYAHTYNLTNIERAWKYCLQNEGDRISVYVIQDHLPMLEDMFGNGDPNFRDNLMKMQETFLEDLKVSAPEIYRRMYNWKANNDQVHLEIALGLRRPGTDWWKAAVAEARGYTWSIY